MRYKKVCYNCGTMLHDNNRNCPVCNSLLTKISITDGIRLSNMNGEQRLKWVEKQIGHPISDKELEKHQKYCDEKLQKAEQWQKEKQAKLKVEQEAKLRQIRIQALDKVNNDPKCPICGSTNINKITLTTRAVKTATFGVVGAIDDAGKTWKCGNCGSRF